MSMAIGRLLMVLAGGRRWTQNATTDGQRQIDGRTDGQMDGWTDGRADVECLVVDQPSSKSKLFRPFSTKEC